MGNIDFTQLSNDELLKKLDDAAFIERFEKGNDWSLIREACDRLAKQAELNLLKADPIKQPTLVIECQVVVKLCRNILPGIVGGIKAEGHIAFDEAKQRGIQLKFNGL